MGDLPKDDSTITILQPVDLAQYYRQSREIDAYLPVREIDGEKRGDTVFAFGTTTQSPVRGNLPISHKKVVLKNSSIGRENMSDYTNGVEGLQLVPLSALGFRNDQPRRAATSTVVKRVTHEVVEPVPEEVASNGDANVVSTTTTTTTTGGTNSVTYIPKPTTAQWIGSLLILLFLTPFLVNAFMALAIKVTYAYYEWVFVNPAQLSATFWDRTMWALIFFFIVYLGYEFINFIALLIGKYAGWVYANDASSVAVAYRQNVDILFGDRVSTLNMTFYDFLLATYNWIKLNLFNFQFMTANIAWNIHRLSRLFIHGLFYTTLIFFLYASVVSQFGIPYTLLPTRDSKILGVTIQYFQRAYDPVGVLLGAFGSTNSIPVTTTTTMKTTYEAPMNTYGAEYYEQVY